MSAAETVAAYIANANNARRDGAAYMAQEWERVADELARADDRLKREAWAAGLARMRDEENEAARRELVAGLIYAEGAPA